MNTILEVPATSPQESKSLRLYTQTTHIAHLASKAQALLLQTTLTATPAFLSLFTSFYEISNVAESAVEELRQLRKDLRRVSACFGGDVAVELVEARGIRCGEFNARVKAKLMEVYETIKRVDACIHMDGDGSAIGDATLELKTVLKDMTHLCWKAVYC
ncbi:hypothetical protein BCR33DRAFT_717467 [Rhizoclosmatium globosum]|uniref:Uncharacterized protein n=1 Tax=Rhizoclosmatium globosum TaxID=329046 RepID=A0A1Y2C9W9_9FUNG|nr:hypothetical protein BCR33DRAFT_717467 [Rhizoclosmatium globosum]|eukprot:ORY43832.1 hypothetical protein BCR33DRAFT_717467 [Rhizoclosmatium globosum]